LFSGKSSLGPLNQWLYSLNGGLNDIVEGCNQVPHLMHMNTVLMRVELGVVIRLQSIDGILMFQINQQF
jgi:hypothetical protein